ncbi:hypothetical protein GT348_01285 [Aristophania vespae]|uniref:Uncharacterized protein n=1 Tax=Aristophania vespae TaxID=2697033 RepID=A0A6P1N9M0_9PROT|nr:hypothetical protein [Aristophania vespae]QHI95106.1 hypothetical protein GT348_01285 [Aristophania vespae]UMM64308.1 hypothetical protein DM15PD_13200 [Aristophania vespae]
MVKSVFRFSALGNGVRNREIIGLIVAISLVAVLFVLGFLGVSLIDGFHLAGG